MHINTHYMIPSRQMGMLTCVSQGESGCQRLNLERRRTRGRISASRASGCETSDSSTAQTSCCSPGKNNDIIKPISPLQHDKKSQPQRDRRKGDLQCECARAFSSWSRERIFFRSPQMCTGTVFLPCEPTGGASACCSRRKLFHIRRKHVPWGRDRSYLLRSMWCHHVVVLTIMSCWWWFDHIVNHFFLFQYLGPCVCRCFLMALLSRNICGVFLIITVIMMTLLAMKSIINSSKDWNWCLGKPSFIIFFGVTWWWFTLVHPLCGQAMVLLTSSCRSFFGFILHTHRYHRHCHYFHCHHHCHRHHHQTQMLMKVSAL